MSAARLTVPLFVNKSRDFLQAIDNRWVVLGLLFGVLGPLAIPILWRSRAFTWPWKVILSVAVCLYITLLAWCAWLALQMAWQQWRGVLEGHQRAY
jgi:hypothetical protein